MTRPTPQEVESLIATAPGPRECAEQPMATSTWIAGACGALRALSAAPAVAPPLEPPAKYLLACWERHRVHQPIAHAMWLTMLDTMYGRKADAAQVAPAPSEPSNIAAARWWLDKEQAAQAAPSGDAELCEELRGIRDSEAHPRDFDDSVDPFMAKVANRLEQLSREHRDLLAGNKALRAEIAAQAERVREFRALLIRCRDGFRAYIMGRKMARRDRDKLAADIDDALERTRAPEGGRDG